MVASIAIGATGLVAVPAEAANGVSTANYYVNNPAIGSAADITPESATVSASIDTGGSPESLLPIAPGGLNWGSISTISAGEKWNDGSVASAQTLTGAYVPVDGIPDSGSNNTVSVTITDTAISNSGVTDPGIGSKSGVPQSISNAGADNYSDVTFEYDPVSDYDVTDNQPGSETNQIQDIQVPTTAGISNVTATLGAFGQAAQTSTGNTPLTPGTKYYYWVVQQAGATSAASNINVSAWVNNQSSGVAANNKYSCQPNLAIEADPTLNALYQAGSAATVNFGGQTLPFNQGPCIYYFGDTGGALYYQSPNGIFTTPALGTVKIGKTATTGSLTITDKSAYKASGTVELTVGKKVAGTAKFRLQPKASGSFKIKLTSAGKKAMNAGKTVKVAPVSTTATVASTSNWDQPFVGKKVKL
jgi:hypothetical protein